ncbi:hypothetical protein [Mucilaginibacter kameinonensis]|uniref:hypothetical protein n=1 Tax=Mucilaginibacter kameinonensis TaxID=452286 RepID=UPI000EF7871C|nr:hypothetical protein [Mucilaginibacter kameinonensis]
MKTKFRPGRLMLLIFFIAVANQSIAQSADKSEADNGVIMPHNDADTLGNGNNTATLMPPVDPLKNGGIIYDDKADDQIKNGALKIASKKYSKLYTASKLDELMIDNRFGEVKINTWNRNEFSVEVQVNIYADKQTDAQGFLNAINISDSRREALVSFKTIIGDNGINNVNVLWKGEDKPRIKKIEINYIVFMPAKNALSISNNYGTTILPDFEGKLMLNSLYSNLKAKKLINPLNYVKVNFGNVDIEGFSGTRLEVLHGSLDLNEGSNFSVSVSYGPARIGKIYSSATIDARFGKQFRIENIDKNIKTLHVNAAYTSVQVGRITGVNANCDVSTYYGTLNNSDPQIKLTSDKALDNQEKSYKGRLGKGDANRNIVIKTNFGRVNFD